MKRRGGVLLEVLISIALFVGAGAFAMKAMRQTFVNIERAQREQLAVDVARSKMAELEAGLIALADLRGERIREVGSHALDEGWTCEVRTRRTEYRDLTLVELTVRDGEGEGAAWATLRQLVKLREFDPEEYEEDELLRGLDRGDAP